MEVCNNELIRTFEKVHIKFVKRLHAVRFIYSDVKLVPLLYRSFIFTNNLNNINMFSVMFEMFPFISRDIFLKIKNTIKQALHFLATLASNYYNNYFLNLLFNRNPLRKYIHRFKKKYTRPIKRLNIKSIISKLGGFLQISLYLTHDNKNDTDLEKKQ